MDLVVEFAKAANGGAVTWGKDLVAKGVSPNATAPGYTGPPIILAVTQGHEDMARWLLSIDVEKPPELLHCATCSNRREKFTWLVEQLIRDGADVNRVTGGTTPMFFLRDRRLMELAFEHGGRLDHLTDEGATALHYAAKLFAPIDVLELMLDKGTQLDAKDHQGRTPLDWAMKNGPSAKAIVTFLKKRQRVAEKQAPAARGSQRDASAEQTSGVVE